MGKKITQYPNNVSTNPDNLSLLDLSEKTGASTFESRKWNLTAFKAWVNSWVVAGSVAWSNITGKPNVVDTTGGTANYVAKFTDTDTIEESQIQDNGTIVGIGYTPAELSAITSTKIALKSIDKTIAIDVTNEFADGIAIYGNATGAGNRVAGIKGITGNSANVNIGVSGTGNSTTGKIGIGGDFNAQGSGTNYALQLRDGTEGTGKFLKCIDGAQGYANWADISVAWNDITSKPTLVDTTGGTANYISKFTDANTIEESQIFDDGTLVGLGIATPEAKLHITNTTNEPSLLIEDENNPDQTPFIINNYGLVGIGTKNPQAKLHLYLEDNRNFLIVNNPTGVTLLASNDAVNTYRDLHFDSNQFKFKINGTEIATIATNSCIGVGTNLPTASLHIANGSINDSFRVDDEGSDTTYFVIDNDGNVGVGGSANVGRKLNIKSNKAVGIAVSQSSQGTSIDGRSTIAGSSANFGVITFASNSTTQNIGIDSVASGGATSSNIGLRADVSGGLTNYCFQGLDGTQGEGKFLKSVTNDGKANWGYVPKVVQLAVSDETTALTTGTGKITFRMPYGMTLTEVRASLTTAQTSGSIVQVDINEGGTSILSTKITLDNGEKTSVTALTPPVLSDTSLADDSEITVDIDQLGDGTAKGLKITLIGY